MIYSSQELPSTVPIGLQAPLTQITCGAFPLQACLQYCQILKVKGGLLVPLTIWRSNVCRTPAGRD